MSDKRQIPAFESEAEEARWWFENREARDEEFAQAIAEGRAGKNTLATRAARSRMESPHKPASVSSPMATTPASHSAKNR